MKYVFITGVPGSRWGRLEWILRDNTEIVDNSHWMPYLQDTPKNSTEHFHRFFGPYHQYGEKFDCLHLLGPEGVIKECERAFDPSAEGKIRFIRSHWFSYQLDWIAENLPEVDILMMMREPQMSLNWWLESGGWNIEYPCYKWYGNTEHMRRQIFIENECMEKFIRKHQLKMTHNVKNTPMWVDEHWNNWNDYLPPNKTYHLPFLKDEDSSLYPVLYRGKESCEF